MDKEIISAIINAAAVIIAAFISKQANKNSELKKFSTTQILLILILAVNLFNSFCLIFKSDHDGSPETSFPSANNHVETEALPPQEIAPSIQPISTTTTETSTNESVQYVPGSTISYGKYEQDNNEVNGPEAIKWIVLNQEDSTLLLISEKGLDSFPYEQSNESADWSSCSIRDWLNGTFYHNAFSDDEKQNIITDDVVQHSNISYPNTEQGDATTDSVYLLSSQEFETYMQNGNITTKQRYGIPSIYSKENYSSEKKLDLTNGYGWWWLRTSGEDLGAACCVLAYGKLNDGRKDINATGGLIRPVIRIKVP